MFFYRLYGLTLQSNFAILGLTELPVAAKPAEVTLQLIKDGSIGDYLPEKVAEQPIALQVSREDALLYLRRCGVFLVQGGSKIVIIAQPDLSLDSLCYALLSLVMAVLLYQRGRLVLHGSTAIISGSAVTFLGDSGAGKSSTLAALYAQGHGMVADDLTAVDPQPSGATVCPGVPRLKLSRATAEILGLQAVLGPVIEGAEESFCSTAALPDQAFPLTCLFILGVGPQITIEPIPPHQALVELLRYAGLRSVLDIRDSSNFLQAALLAKRTRLYRLQRPQSLENLPDLAKILTQHVRASLLGPNRLEYDVFN
ncbi:MAG: hypothetical protein HC934_09795 [Acaryochloridaceae cyanobacterium SU_2_1]|nr:hypothetical protein [Acaryochloridaceae cyanobacterium SU_2_1]